MMSIPSAVGAAPLLPKRMFWIRSNSSVFDGVDGVDTIAGIRMAHVRGEVSLRDNA